MMKRPWLRMIGMALALVVILAVVAQAQGRKPQPPELKQLMAASQLKDAGARLKEFERIKEAYPQSEYMSRIDEYIFRAKVELADTLDAVLELQSGMIAKAEGPDRLGEPYMAAEQILEHPKLKTFDKARVMAAVQKYQDEAAKASEEPATFKGIPQDDQTFFKTYYLSGFKVLLARAYLNEGAVDKAQTTLEAYKKEGGSANADYSFTLADVLDRQGRAKEAYESYLDAALDNHEGALDKAKALYVKINGKPDGFDAKFEAKLRTLPYEPEPFKPSAEWKGKAVLAEIFTGSECPPCVGADLGYDGLIEAYPAKYLAILEYHLPIPRPDPMINPATKKRQAYYDVNSTPSTFFDGEAKLGGGGGRSMSGDKCKKYEAEVNSRVNAAPGVMLQATASRAGDVITVECGFDKVVPGTEYIVVLAQKEEKYKGSNGLIFHKLVVRDQGVLDPAAGKSVTFDLAASEKATDAYLTDFEKTYDRIPNFKFAERHNMIDRKALRVVFFAQDKASKKVLNAVVAEVK